MTDENIRRLPKKPKPPDENDKAVAGTLPADPFDGLVEKDLADVIALDKRRWRLEILSTDKGPSRDTGNAALLLANDPQWEGCLAYDEFNGRLCWTKQPPIIVGLKRPRLHADLSDDHYVYIQHALKKLYGIPFTKPSVVDAVGAACQRNIVNPLQDWLKSLQWDGEERLSTWLRDYLGVADSDYADWVGRWWLISACARALDPGCQADHMLVLEGPQGKGKTQALRTLGGKWYLGNPPNFRDSKAVAEVIQGKWIVEIGELDAMRGAAETRIKEFLTQTRDVYRPAYARFAVERGRTQVFAGTTNEERYLGDHTGNRRFWPVRCDGEIAIAKLRQDRDQLWAEARDRFLAGEHWYPDDSTQVLAISSQQEERQDVDAWEEKICAWLAGMPSVTVQDVLGSCLGAEPRHWDRASQARVRAALSRAGWAQRRLREGTERVRRYFPPGSEG